MQSFRGADEGGKYI